MFSYYCDAGHNIVWYEFQYRRIPRRVIKFVCLRVRAAAAGLQRVCDFYTHTVYRKYIQDEVWWNFNQNVLGNIEKNLFDLCIFWDCLINFVCARSLDEIRLTKLNSIILCLDFFYICFSVLFRYRKSF